MTRAMREARQRYDEALAKSEANPNDHVAWFAARNAHEDIMDIHRAHRAKIHLVILVLIPIWFVLKVATAIGWK